MKKIGFLLAAATGVVAIGLNTLYALLVIFAESAWGPFAESALNRFAVVGMTGVVYFTLTWFTFSMLKAATERKRSRSTTEEAPAHVGLIYFLMGLVVWFGGSYLTTIDRTDIYGGVIILMIAIGLFSAGGHVLSRAKI